MKRTLLFFVVLATALVARGDIGDAFKGIWPVTDTSVMKSLNGEWLLRVVKHIEQGPAAVPEADDSWRTIPVPGCWEPYGFAEPRYNYPDSLTGYYRTTFTVPSQWRGQQVIIRLDGVLRGYDLWLNDQLVGTWESGYNTCLFDLTPYLTPKAFRGEPQRLALRVYSRFKGYEFDCFDDWATMGIFRDVTLFPVPRTHLADLTVTTAVSGEVTVKTAVANPTRYTSVDVELVSPVPHPNGTARTYHASGFSRLDTISQQANRASRSSRLDSLSLTIPQADLHLWTAETPYLYTLRVRVREKKRTLQTFTQKIGVREITTEGNVLKINGQAVKLRGVNAHSTDPRTVKVISDSLTLKDMRMMKEASVNYMRLSHYPREPRFFELADSLGFYLVDEVPFGFGDKYLSNRKYQDILMTRALATVTRDKNHPSVIVWSVGNENPLPKTCIEVGDYVGSLDSSRPYCFPQVGSYFRRFWESKGLTPSETAASPFPSKAPVYAPHYPTTGQMAGFFQHLDRPVIFTEYCHTLGISFEDHDRQWEIIERTPGIAGGSVWEWADQGMPFVRKNGGRKWRTDGSARDQFVYTSNDGGFEMNGNFGTDGLVYADRTPLPNYYELQHNYARAFLSLNPSQTELMGPISPESPINLQLLCHNRYDFLNLRDNVVFRWYLTADRDTVASGSFSPDCPPHATVPHSLSLGDAPLPQQPCLLMLHADVTDTQGLVFLRQSFVLSKAAPLYAPSLSSLSPDNYIQEQTVRAGRKATMGERITQKGLLPKRYLLPVTDGIAVQADTARLLVDIRTADIEGGREVSFTLQPDSADIFRAEMGLAYLLDAKIDRVQWMGYGPFASYPARRQACRYGLWAKHCDDLYFEGNHAGIDAALFSDSQGNGLLVVGDSLNLNFEQTDRGIVMTVNAAVSGQGPKFAKTHFPGWRIGDGPVSASFRIYPVEAGQWPGSLHRLFMPAADVPDPFRPFLTQYDTYLLRYQDIRGK